MLKDFFNGRNKGLIVVVDDEPETGLLLCKLLESHGFRSKIARNGPEGLELILKHNPNLVLLDIMMPGVDGFDILSQIKTDERIKDVPVIMCSVLNSMSDVEKCCKSGAAGYITKPFDIERVLDKVNDALK